MPDTTTHPAMLLVKLHEKNSQELEVSSDTFTIGRKSDNSLAIEDSAVSARHARIVKVLAVYFLEDLNSTNGTFLNDKRVDRHQLRDTDVITIGRHRIIFRDGSATAPAPSGSTNELDQTMVLTGQAARRETAVSPASIRVVAGKTDQSEYLLTKQVTAIGAHTQAAIRLTGWFAPKTAAMITRRNSRYFVSNARQGKMLIVNDHNVAREQELKDGDRIEVAGVQLAFRMKTGKKA